MALSVVAVMSTERFLPSGRSSDEPHQVLHVSLERTVPDGPVHVEVTGSGVQGSTDIAVGEGEVRVEVPLRLPSGTAVGERLPVRVEASIADGTSVSRDGEVVVAETGWTMVMVSHFHYDPVWWNTQASYTTDWDLLGGDWTTRPSFLHNAFALVEAHLKLAVRDPDYHFVLAEVDYLKPYFDTHPEQRIVLRRLLAQGRVELIGGTYNEPNTNLTGAETTIRNLVYGVGFQRDILGGDPRTAWQLDAFGHDPQFPGLVAKAGLTGSAWARGPHHQWGPIRQHWDQERSGDVRAMQFESEFEWISPSGDGVLTHYMPDHYGPGWEMQDAPTVEAAGDIAYELFQVLKPVAATRNTLLPVGGDYCPPNNWVTELHRWWNARYAWPRFVCGTTRMFLDRVRDELAEQGRTPSPQSRDMNPVYTGKDVSYIDTKQAQRAAESAAVDAERLATFACLLGEGRYPEAALDKVWRQLAFNAHHDAITGSESDQVYIDLLTGWREAYDLAVGARDAAARALVGRVDTTGEGQPLVVVNTLAFTRTDLVHAQVDTSDGVMLVDDSGAEVPVVVEAPGVVRFVARDIPSVGWRTFRILPAQGGDQVSRDHGWHDVPDAEASIENAAYRLIADPAQGGALISLWDKARGRELLTGPGNELRVYEEYPAHPTFSEGPWHLLPTGRVHPARDSRAEVLVQRSPVGQRLVARGRVDGLDYEQVTTLVDGLDRVDFGTRFLDHQQSDRLVRVRFPVDQPGGLPVSEVAAGVIGRGFGLIDADSAEAPWTLDNPANTWFGIGTTMRVEVTDGGQRVGTRAVAVVEVIVPDELGDRHDAAGHDGSGIDSGHDESGHDESGHDESVRDLVVALARRGVTATTSRASGSRYGNLAVDSNLPDTRIVLAGRGSAVLDEIEGRTGPLPDADVVFVPAARPLQEVWRPHADLRDLDALPIVVIRDVAAAVAAVTAGALQAVLAPGEDRRSLTEPHEDGTVALLTYGLPGFAVEPDGSLNLSLMRSCTGWPSGIWIDPPRRTTPDGSSFQLQHWTHELCYALVSSDGDWRDASLPASGQAYSTPLLPVSRAPVESAGDADGGDLPATHSLLKVQPERAVLVSTVKAAGNPVASGSSRPADPRHAVTLRLVEAHGSVREATIHAPSSPFLSAAAADLLENPREQVRVSDGALLVDLPGSGIETIVATMTTRPERAGASVLGPDREVAQPLYSRYWLHNRGPAPMGFLPVTVALTPLLARIDAGGRVELSWVVASQYADSTVDVTATLDLPLGWSASSPEVRTTLDAQGYARFRSWVTVAVDAEPGLYTVAVQVVPQSAALAGGAAVQVVEDTTSIFVGDSAMLTSMLGFGLPTTADLARSEQAGVQPHDEARPTGLDVTLDATELRVPAGGCATLVVALTNRTRSPIRGELQLASPWGTWSWVDEAVRAFSVPSGGRVEVPVDVRPPADTAPGHAWLMPKVMWFGRAQYTETVRLEVTP